MVSRPWSVAVLLGLCGLCAWPASAQGGPGTALAAIDGPPPPLPPAVVARDSAGRVTVRATRLAEPIVVDGRLDEPDYQSVFPISNFIQQEPHEGQPATERTEAWIFFDDRTLYVSARCYESDPTRRVANEMRRDNMNLFNNDHFAVILDTFYDRRNGFMFYVNPLGGFFDGQVTDERETNRDWNTVWRSKTADFDGGWTVEMAIPFQSLRYRAGDVQVWGLNFRRSIKANNELDYLTPIAASFGRNGIARLSQAATLVGLEPRTHALNLEVKPYATAGVRTDLENDISNDPTKNMGLDVKYGLTRSLTLDATVRTDFAQVEDDEQRVNLTRFSLFFPEKREFFLEGQGIFQFGGAGGRGGGGGGFGPNNTPILFFSRRIGLQNGYTVPVLAGGRLTGKTGPYSIGLLNMQTEAESAAEALSTNFSVVRVKRDILRRSTIGLLWTRRSPVEAGAGANNVAGLDASFAFFQNLSINTYFAKSDTPERRGDDESYRAQVQYMGDRYGFEAERLSVGSNFNPEIGYVRRDDIIRSYVQARFSPRLPSVPAIRKLSWEGSVDYFDNRRGVISTRDTQGQFQIQFENSDEFQVEVTDAFERLDEAFEPADGVVIPVGDYHTLDTRVSYRLGTQRKISGSINASRGGYYDGNRTEVGYRGRVEVTPRFSLEPNISWNKVNVPQGDFTSNLFGARATLTLSPRMFIGALVQYTTANDTVGSNVRFRWEYVPGSDLFVVYSDGRDTAGSGFPSIQTRTFVVKIAHLLRF